MNDIQEKVRERYGAIAEGKLDGCCGTGPISAAVAVGYDAKALESLPEGANLGLGCGAPIEALALRPGERVLDLGSGAGVDVFLAARLVGPAGRAIGVDMTPAMVAKARANATRAGFTNVEFLEGRLEALPVADASVDAVTSNCVINLVPDKGVVFREIARVLVPGGRAVISDIVLSGPLPEAVALDVEAYIGCVAGAALREDYLAMVRGAGFGVEVLRDIDYLAAAGHFGEGRVRSITLRMTKA
jgi:SAM-dependent methyltransferase